MIEKAVAELQREMQSIAATLGISDDVIDGDADERFCQIIVAIQNRDLRIKSLKDQASGRAQGASEMTAERIAAWLEECARESINRGGIGASENASSMLLASSLIRGGEWK